VKVAYRSGLKVVLAGLAFALLLSGCAFERNALVATWKLPVSEVVMQFTETGTLRLLLPPATGYPPLEGGYQFINDDTLVFTPTQLLTALQPDQSQPLNLTDRNPVGYTVQNDTLTLSVNGQEFSLQRVK
jgi:hypothetical protein